MPTVMKSVRCPVPACKHEHIVKAAMPAPLTQTGFQTYVWPGVVCENCKKPFEYDGDPRQTRSRIPAS
jgi:hypothetical protein